MNLFFGIKSDLLSCSLTIPKFQNFGKKNNKINLYEAHVENNFWEINKTNCDQDKNFYFINSEKINNHKIFFLAEHSDILKNSLKIRNGLININNFTDTQPAFRSNLKIYNKFGGHSSYQSEYPFQMTKKKGSILSPINMLLNRNADYNHIFFRNIFYKPIIDKSYLYLIDFKKKKILKKFSIQYNHLNEIKIEKEYISENVYLFTSDCLGIPLFLSSKNNHLSFEHTHPPHHYILGDDRFIKIAEIKNEFKKII